MLYLLLVPLVIILFPRLERAWKRFLTNNMKSDYDTLALQILYGCYTFSQATQEIADFKYTWLDHPECEKYVGLLKSALRKYEFENGLGV